MDYELNKREISALVAIFSLALVTLFGSFALIVARGITW